MAEDTNQPVEGLEDADPVEVKLKFAPSRSNKNLNLILL